LVPAMQATGTRLQDMLRADSGTASASRRAVVARSGLVGGPSALHVMWLCVALRLSRTYDPLQQFDLGLQPDRVLTFGIVIPRAHQEDAAAKRTLETIGDPLAALPGVDTGAVTWAP